MERWAVALEELGLEHVAAGPNAMSFTVPVRWRDAAVKLECDLDLGSAAPSWSARLDFSDARPGMVDRVARTAELSIDLLPEVGFARLTSGTLELVGRFDRRALLAIINQLVAATKELLSTGALDVADATSDPSVADSIASLPETKARAPRAAVDLAITAARRCRDLGDAKMSATLDLAAGELLLGLGEVAQAAKLIESAWDLLDRSVEDRATAVVVAALWARQGRLPDSIELVSRSLALQCDARDAALLKGDLGVMLAEGGQRVEAAKLLEAAAADGALEDHLRAHYTEQLGVLRSSVTAAVVEPEDLLDQATASLNEVSARLVAGDFAALRSDRRRIAQLVKEVGESTASLGPAQVARLEMARAVLCYLDGDIESVRRHFDSAVLKARLGGDDQLASWIAGQRESLIDPAGVANTAAGSSLEQLGALANRAMALLPTDPDAAAVAAWGALDVIDGDRHRYESVADRRAWADLAGRAYEVALQCALTLGRPTEFIEVLERVRAQGRPRSGILAPTEPGPASNGGRGEVARALALVREFVGDRPVEPPIVASLDAFERRAATGVSKAPLGDLVLAVAGEPSWWWGCQIFHGRLYWAVRSPDGDVWIGGPSSQDGAALVAAATSAFGSARSVEDLETHVLLGDSGGERDTLLGHLAAWLLPAPLGGVLRAALESKAPITVVWAAPHQLAHLPIGLLPISDKAVVIEAAAFIIAPPTSLGVLGRSISQPRTARAVNLVLGADRDLGMLDGLVRSVAPLGSTVLGAARHVRTGVAASLATPGRVRDLLATDDQALLVYYGHVDQEADDPSSASFALTDGVRPAHLKADDLLVASRDGGPWAVLLAGCSSLSPQHTGTGEWWGLATALLWQGSSHVVGSTWDVLSGPVGERLVAVLAGELRVTDSPARALRRLQARWHREWRETGSPLPYEWAGWAVTSITGPFPST